MAGFRAHTFRGEFFGVQVGFQFVQDGGDLFKLGWGDEELGRFVLGGGGRRGAYLFHRAAWSLVCSAW